MEERRIITKEDDIQYAMKHMLESKLACQGDVWLRHKRAGKILYEGFEGRNTFTTEGLAWALNVLFGATAKSATIYCGLFKNNVTPALADTAAAKLGAGGTYGECQEADYDSPTTNRATYTIAATSTASCTNAASKAEFVMANSSTITLYGAFLTNKAAKTDTTGVLICAKKFTTARAVENNDEIAITYAITLTTS